LILFINYFIKKKYTKATTTTKGVMKAKNKQEILWPLLCMPFFAVVAQISNFFGVS